MINRMMATLAFAVLTVFLGILMWYVPRWDLGAVVLATLVLAAVDLYQTAGERDKDR